jgi:pimeloyl-ACP methyl ester carboxylesterase
MRHGPRRLGLVSSVLGSATAPPLLVLHGITGSRRYWLPRMRPLAERYRLLVPDLPGFGQSPKPFVEYTMSFFVETLLGYLDQCGESRRSLRIVGHSLGALLALELAASGEIEVERLVLLNVPCYSDPDSAHRVMLGGSPSYRRLLTVNSLAASLAQVRRNGWRLTARYVRRLPWAVLVDSRKFTFRSLSSTLEHCLLHYNIDALLRRPLPPVPALLVHGDQDQVAPLAAVERLVELLPHPRLHVIHGAGHNLFHTHHAECMGLLERFLLARRPGGP